MLGTVRPSSASSLGLLELERPNLKIIKDDSLLIYETTILKLKQGSLRNPSIAPENSMETDVYCTTTSDSMEQEAMTIEADFSSTDSLPISSSCESKGTSKKQGTKNLFVLYLFSRFKNSQQHSVSSPDEVDMLVDSALSSTSVSPSTSNSELLRT